MKKRSIILYALLIIMILFLPTIVIPAINLRKQFKTIWDAAKDDIKELREEKFYVVLFPRNSTSKSIAGGVYDTTRGLLVSLAESRQKKIGVYYGEEVVEFGRELFTVYPLLEDYEKSIVELNEAIQKWAESTDWRNIIYSVRSEGSITTTTLRIKYKKAGGCEYVYECDKNDTIKPKSLKIKRF